MVFAILDEMFDEFDNITDVVREFMLDRSMPSLIENPMEKPVTERFCDNGEFGESFNTDKTKMYHYHLAELKF